MNPDERLACAQLLDSAYFDSFREDQVKRKARSEGRSRRRQQVPLHSQPEAIETPFGFSLFCFSKWGSSNTWDLAGFISVDIGDCCNKTFNGELVEESYSNHTSLQQGLSIMFPRSVSSSSDPPISASQVAGIRSEQHCVQFAFESNMTSFLLHWLDIHPANDVPKT